MSVPMEGVQALRKPYSCGTLADPACAKGAGRALQGAPSRPARSTGCMRPDEGWHACQKNMRC